ncbi:MAG: DUF2339 domain-containing protein [Methylacidiphilales bacterium]|nr:DUF2339 domain-containing protein [Candidatus Methylacidiphilales bacterium]
MTPEDRDLLQNLRRQQLDLQRSLAHLDVQLGELEARLQATPALEPPELPPFPTEHLPPLPPHGEVSTVASPPSGAEAALPLIPPIPEPVVVATRPPPSASPIHPTFPEPPTEFQFGKWLTAIGAVFGIFTLAFILALPAVYHFLGSAGLLGISAAVSVAIYVLGERLERSRPSLALFGRTIMAMALAWLYLTAYASYYYAPLRVISSPLLAGFLLLLWSAYVLLLAKRKKSQVLAVFSIFLAYVSSAINPIGAFTMLADLILAFTAVVFLLRNGWAVLSYLSLIGTYLALLRRLVIGENGEIVLDTSRELHFWPLAVYLLGAWVIFTAAVLFSNAAAFRGGKRSAFLSLNNGALAVLLALATHISGYDLGPLGWAVLDCGLLLLATSVAARVLRADEPDVAGAYLGQGLALLTTGIIVVYTGISRGVLLALETLFLGFAGAFSRSIILRASACVVAFLATLFLIEEVAISAHHPWLLGIGGALILGFNAWWARRDVRHDPQNPARLVPTAVYYCILALGLVFTTMDTELGNAALPPALAVVALVLTLSIYLVPLYELPPTAQTFLFAAQGFALFPVETGEPLPGWSNGLVAVITLYAITWWAHQRVTCRSAWIILLNLVYSLALAGLVYNAVRPHVDAAHWLIISGLLSLVFLLYGAVFRVWLIALVGQIFLGLSVCHFFVPPGGWNLHAFNWSWEVAGIPILVVFAVGHAVHQWIRISPEITVSSRTGLGLLAHAYQFLALIMLARWISAVIPTDAQIVTFFLLGTGLLHWNFHRTSVFGFRASYFPTALGCILYLHRFGIDALSVTTGLTGLAALTFLTQPVGLRRGGSLVSQVESWIIILLSAGLGWFFVSSWVVLRINPSYLTLSWALFGLFLFLLGFLVRERRLRWCGLGIVLAAILRVALYDFWGFSTGYRVLTFLVLTIVTLGLGFIYARFVDRLRTWL